MGLTRRQFLRLTGASSVGAVLFAGCTIPDQELWVQSPVGLPEDLATGVDNWYATLCRQCPSTEGVLVRVMEGRAKKIEGNPDYPTNAGKHSARCEAALQALYHPDRLREPMRRRGGVTSPVGGGDPWGEALSEVAAKLNELKGRPERVALITQLLRGHLAAVVERFVRDYGMRHYTLAPQEDVVLRRAIKDVFGQDHLPHFDLANTRFLLSFGADFLGTWVSPVAFGRAYGQFRQGQQRERGIFWHVGPRFSMTAANAERWLPIRPGTEGILALGLAFLIIERDIGRPDSAVVDALTGGRGADALRDFGPERVVRDTGLADYFGEARARELLEELATRLGEEKPSLVLAGGEAAAHTNGLFSLRAAYTLNYLLGSVGRKGGVILNPGPALSDIPASSAVSSYRDWQGLVNDLRSGGIDLLMVRGADPVHALASLDFGGALQGNTFVVTFSSFADDTALKADLVLPEHTALEDWGDDIPDPAPGYQVIGFQQPTVRPLYNTRSFGDVVLDLARRAGVAQGEEGLTFRQVLQEGAGKLFLLNRGLIKGASTPEEFWQAVLARGVWADPEATGPDPIAPPQLPTQVPEPPPPPAGDSFYLVPFASPAILGGENAHLPWLQATPDPVSTVVWTTWVEMNERKAEEMGLRRGDVVRVRGPRGQAIEALVYPHPAVAPNVVAIPFGQGHQDFGRYGQGRGSNVMSILASQLEGETGAHAWAATKVTLEPTGRNRPIPRNEGETGTIRETHEGEVVKVTRPE